MFYEAIASLNQLYLSLTLDTVSLADPGILCGAQTCEQFVSTGFMMHRFHPFWLSRCH